MQRHVKRPAEQIAGNGGDLELEVIVTDDGLALLPSEVNLLGVARGIVDAADGHWSGVPPLDVTAALERLGRLTARALERLADDVARLDPHDAADRAWRIVETALEHAERSHNDHSTPADLEAAVNAHRWLDRHAEAYDERVEHQAEEFDRLRDEAARSAARVLSLEVGINTVLEGARLAGGGDAFQGRYEALGIALESLERTAARP